ncbi:MAG: PEGA domain-containing protein [Nannocystis sp.]|nr:PEGA domain-containing protein [Nannocystis sp.]
MRGSLVVYSVLGALALGCASGQVSAPLTITAPAEDEDAEVFVDGNYVGQVAALSSGSAGPLLLAPGVHRVEVRKPGRYPVQRTVRVDRKQAAAVVIEAVLLEEPQP